MTGSIPWRLFVAVPIGEELRLALAAPVQAWRERPDLASLRWTDPESWHLTLLFLGPTDPARVGPISDLLRATAAHHEAMDLDTGGLGGFGSASRAHVAWYGVSDPERRLGRLADDVRAALAPDDAARFRAHVTLARARSVAVDLRAWIGDARPPEGRLEIGEVRLMRSHVGAGPARYETLSRAALGAPVRV